MTKYIIENLTNNENVERYTVVDIEKAKQKWVEDEGYIDGRGLYLSSKGRYYKVVANTAKFVDPSYVAAYLFSKDLELPEDLKHLAREIVE